MCSDKFTNELWLLTIKPSNWSLVLLLLRSFYYTSVPNKQWWGGWKRQQNELSNSRSSLFFGQGIFFLLPNELPLNLCAWHSSVLFSNYYALCHVYYLQCLFLENNIWTLSNRYKDKILFTYFSWNLLNVATWIFCTFFLEKVKN